jgi:DNA replication protein DnaC
MGANNPILTLPSESPEITDLERSIQDRLKKADVPEMFLDTSFQSLDPTRDPTAFQACHRFALDGKYDDKSGLLLLGSPGNGKTSLSVAIMRHVIERFEGRYGVRFWNVPRGLQAIRQSFGDQYDGPQQDILSITRNKLVVIDDLGRQKMTEWVADQFYVLIDTLWCEKKKVVITSNLEHTALMGSQSEALNSRLLGMCHVVEFNGDDMRI